MVLTRMAQGGEQAVHIIKSTTIEEIGEELLKAHTSEQRVQMIGKILEELFKGHPQKERVRMLMDSGALFKDFSNFEVAQALRNYLNIPVLFFMRNAQKGEKTPDTLALLKPGSDIPIIIGGTRIEDIEMTGLGIDDYFVFDDDRHTTGTDIPVILDGIGLMTLDETMLRRTFFQTILRLRDYFTYQNVEFVIPEHILKLFLPDQIEH